MVCAWQSILRTSTVYEEEEERGDPQPEHSDQSKNNVTQHANDGIPIITSKDMADYDWLKAKGTTMKMQK